MTKKIEKKVCFQSQTCAARVEQKGNETTRGETFFNVKILSLAKRFHVSFNSTPRKFKDESLYFGFVIRTKTFFFRFVAGLAVPVCNFFCSVFIQSRKLVAVLLPLEYTNFCIM